PFPFGCRRFVVGITQCAREELMARRPYVTQVDLRFGNSPCQLKNLRGGACSGNVTREWLNFFRQSGIGKDGPGLARGGARSLLSGPYPERSSAPCLRARSRDLPLPCPR